MQITPGILFIAVQLLCFHFHIVQAAGWMANLPPFVTIDELNIPGTHDSGTYRVESSLLGRLAEKSAKTQSMSLSEQMQAGIRYLDIRLKLTSDGELDLHHGPVDLKYNVDNVMSDITTFVRNNPTEFVVVKIQQESSKDDQFRTVLATKLRPYTNMFYLAYSQAMFPMVQALRGRILLVTKDFQYNPSQDGFFSWLYGNMMSIQDDWKTDVDNKQGDVLTTLNQSAASYGGMWVINQVSMNSLKDGMDSMPESAASKLNPLVSQWITAHQATHLRIGTVVMDFPPTTLISQIIQLNFASPARRRYASANTGLRSASLRRTGPQTYRKR